MGRRKKIDVTGAAKVGDIKIEQPDESLFKQLINDIDNIEGESAAAEEENKSNNNNVPSRFKDNLDDFYSTVIEKNNPWLLDEKGVQSVKAAMSMLSTKTGMYTKIPMYCKGTACPYEATCQMLKYNIQPEGQSCPIEVAQIKKRYELYAQEFDLGGKDASFTDENLVCELITLEIYMERCKALMAKEGNPVIEVVIGLSDSGEEIKQPSISKAWESYERMSKKRDANYNLLMATRKDKKSIKNDEATSYNIADIIAEAESDPNFYDIDEDGGENQPVSVENKNNAVKVEE
jgi:hypothetical protein